MVSENDQSGTLGSLIKKLRGNRQQKEIASELGVSASFLSEVEHGKKPPSPRLLDAIASHFKADRLGLAHLIFLSFYFESLPLAHQDKNRSDMFWRYIEAGIKKLADKGLSELDGIHQVRALAKFAEEYQFLDLEGQIAWQATLLNASPKLECFWVAQGNFHDDSVFYDVAKANIANGTKYVYFLRDVPELNIFQRFREYKSRLASEIGSDAVQERVVEVPFGEKENIVTLDFVVANPDRDDNKKAVGFCRIHNDFDYNIRFPADVLKQRIKQLDKYVVGRKKPKIPQTALYAAEEPSIDLS